jgi:LDH2 family malate/lactate/ureidoglycolate dehydrogenase
MRHQDGQNHAGEHGAGYAAEQAHRRRYTRKQGLAVAQIQNAGNIGLIFGFRIRYND